MDNATKERIIDFNRRLGLNTEFITAEDILGYAEDNTIFINESVEQDYERTNKHEVLHFFENTPEFEELKKIMLSSVEKRLEQIRSEYEVRYFGIYSEEEISLGVIDNEIVIDLLVDNSIIEYENGLKVGDKLLGEIERGIEERRYLNLSVRKNVQNMNLSDWEKLFVENHYDGKEHILPQAIKTKGITREDALRTDIDAYLQQLYDMGEEEFVIDPHSPEVIREYESTLKALQSRGEDSSFLKFDMEQALIEIAHKHSQTQFIQYRHIVDLLKNSNYDPAFKCLMLKETLSKTYKLDTKDEERKTIIKKRDRNKSIAGHMILNEQTLEYIYTHSKDYGNFAELYFSALEEYRKLVLEKSEIWFEDVETYGKGEWIKFEGKESNEEEYLKNSERLTALVHDTPWCTKEMATEQLETGDFYVFVDHDGKPHIAIRMEGKTIAEVRGVKNGEQQIIEEDYRDVAISLLRDNREIEGGQKWLKREETNEKLKEHRDKIESGKFTIEDVPSLIECLLYKDANKGIVMQSLFKVKSLVAEYYECSEDEIYIGNIDFSETDFEINPYKIILGDVDFYGPNIRDLGNLQVISGEASFEFSSITDLKNLRIIGGDAIFQFSQVTNLGNLQRIGGEIFLGDSKLMESIPQDGEHTITIGSEEIREITLSTNQREVMGVIERIKKFLGIVTRGKTAENEEKDR